ncbi:MAG: hypothetical protein EOM63_02780 [Clostridia bacterium]|nr:hypothetical protein [Clostridia bacterium]
MIDVNDLAKRCQDSVTDPQARAAMQKAMEQLKGGAGEQLARSIPPAYASSIERAAQAAQRGDKTAAMAAMQEILATPEGAALAQKLQFLLGKS